MDDNAVMTKASLQTNTEKVVALLRDAANIIEARAREYSGEGDMFVAIAKEAACRVEDVFSILSAVKQVRLDTNPNHRDSLVDKVAYNAFALVYRNEKQKKEKFSSKPKAPDVDLASIKGPIAVVNTPCPFKSGDNVKLGDKRGWVVSIDDTSNTKLPLAVDFGEGFVRRFSKDGTDQQDRRVELVDNG